MTLLLSSDFDDADIDLRHIADLATSIALFATDRKGRSKRTMQGVIQYAIDSVNSLLASQGYSPPVAYSASLIMTGARQTVTYLGLTYAPNLSDLPFTTSGIFEASKFRLVIGLSAADLAAGVGAQMVGFTHTDVSAAARTVSAALSDSIDIRALGAKGDGSDDWAAIQAVVDRCILLGKSMSDHKGGSFGLSQSLDFNGTGHAEPANAQWVALKGFRGAGRMSTVFLALPGFSSTDWILKARNTAGTSYQDFGYNGLGNAVQGFDSSWTGGQLGDPNTAPSNHNIRRNIYGEGVSGWGFNFDQCHDSVIDGIWSKGVAAGNTAFTFRGAGGQVSGSRIYASTGRVVMACQNGGFSDCGFFGGYEITGSGFNAIVHNNVHFYPDPTTSILVRSSSTGSAPSGCVFAGCFFNPTPGWVFGGAWWQGAKLTGCLLLNAASGFYAPVTPLAGTGDLPLFSYEHCTILGASFPGDVTNQVESSHWKTRTNTGASFTSVRIPGALSANSVRTAGLVVGGPGAVLPADAVFSVQNGLARFSNAIPGLTPAATAGMAVGWNRSGGFGEVSVFYSGGGGSDPRIEFVNISSGTPITAMTVRNASWLPGVTDVTDIGSGAYRIKQVYAANTTISNSDRDLKDNIAPITDAVLDAWGEVEFQQYQFKDAIAEKGDKARLHFGVIAQEVEAAFQRRGLTPFAYGVLCFDKWDDEFETVPAVTRQKVGPVAAQTMQDVEEVPEQRDESGLLQRGAYLRPRVDANGQPVMVEMVPAHEGPLFDDAGLPVLEVVEPEKQVLVRPAGQRYAIRYDQAMVIEAAYQRRRMDRIEARMNGGT